MSGTKTSEDSRVLHQCRPGAGTRQWKADLNAFWLCLNQSSGLQIFVLCVPRGSCSQSPCILEFLCVCRLLLFFYLKIRIPLLKSGVHGHSRELCVVLSLLQAAIQVPAGSDLCVPSGCELLPDPVRAASGTAHPWTRSDSLGQGPTSSPRGFGLPLVSRRGPRGMEGSG